MKKVDALEACESTCHECTLTDEVENYNDWLVLRKRKKIMKKDIKNRKIMRENENKQTSIPQYKSE